VVDDGKWHTVTEVGPDVSRPGKGWLRICTSRVDEADGQVHRRDGDYSPELMFGFMSRAAEPNTSGTPPERHDRGDHRGDH
jgi:hypothetical protein